MSENSSKAPKLTPENKEKIKKFLPIAAIIVAVVIVISIFSAIFSGGGNATNKEAIKLLKKGKASKMISTLPEGFEDNVIKYYEYNGIENRKDLKKAIKSSCDDSIKKVKTVDHYEVDFNNLSDSDLTADDKSAINYLISSSKFLCDDDIEFEDGYVTIFEITVKESDGSKTKKNVVYCSFKYDGKWYSLNTMSFVAFSAQGYSPKK